MNCFSARITPAVARGSSAGRYGVRAASFSVALALASLSTAALAQFESPGDGVYKDRIDVGTMMDMSGPASGSQAIWTTDSRTTCASSTNPAA